MVIYGIPSKIRTKSTNRRPIFFFLLKVGDDMQAFVQQHTTDNALIEACKMFVW